jgi:serine/threonine protein kinase/transcriptional regulator with XRE-family HTH domain
MMLNSSIVKYCAAYSTANEATHMAVDHVPFGILLARYRISVGLTQEELADRAGLSARGISDLERGARTKPQATTVHGLVDALGLSSHDRAIFEEAARSAAPSPTAESEPLEILPTANFLGALPSGQLVAREEELERIRTIFDAVTAGTGQLLLLTGELGVGKTRLAQQIMVEANARGFLAGAGRCYALDQQVPYFPMLEALAGLVAYAPSRSRPDIRRQWRELQAALATNAVTELVFNHEVEERRRLFAAIRNLLTNLTQDGPVALLVDDLHWADRGTITLVEHLVRMTRGNRILLVGTFRDLRLREEHPALAQALQDLSRERLVERITVRRLSSDETATLVSAMIGEVSEEFAMFVHRRTRGNPRFIDQLVRSLGGRLELRRQIGEGSMGRVFEASDKKTGRQVAAKIMLARGGIDLDALLRFQHEGAVLAALEHPNIVNIYDTFIEEHASCIIMELVDGRSLGQILRSGPLTLARAKALTLQVAAALTHAHAHSIAHRDIKPDNIMVTDGDRVKVTDFGIARILGPNVTLQTIATNGMRVGTPLYMAPEQVEGKPVDGRTDIYALGAVIYHMVTGRPPYEGNDPLAVAIMHLQESPLTPSSLKPRLPKDWDEMILKALAKDPVDRYQTVEALTQAVTTLTVDVAVDGDICTALQEGVTPSQLEPPSDSRAVLLVHQPARKRNVGQLVPGLRPARSALTALAGAVLAVSVISLWAESRPQNASASFRPVTGWGRPVVGAPPLSSPGGVAVDRQGNVFVADTGHDQIRKFSPRGLVMATWGGQGSGPGQYLSPAGVAVDRRGNVYVADTLNNRIQELSARGQPIATWGGLGAGFRQFNSPYAVAVTAWQVADHMYVADTGNTRIQELSVSGRWLAQWGTLGSGPEQFEYPRGSAIDSRGNLYVADELNNRVSMFSPSGPLLKTWGTSGSVRFRLPSGVAVDSHGNVYAADTGNDRIVELPAQGGMPITIGTTGSAPGQFRQPEGVAVDNQGNLYVADAGNNRIQKFSPNR